MTTRHKSPSRGYRKEPNHSLSQPPCPFLDLPAELRNRIYEYVLTATHGIKLRWCVGKTRRVRKPVMFVNSEKREGSYSVNQLKYVNHQLRIETAGLEVQYNQITFWGYPGSNGSALKSLYVFAGSCTRTKLLWLNRVTVAQPCDPNTDEALQQGIYWVQAYAREVLELLNFCITHKHICVDFRLPYFMFRPESDTFSANQFMITGHTLLRLFRSGKYAYTESTDPGDAAYSQFLTTVLGDELKASIGRLGSEATNLRIYPHDPEFDIEGFERAVQEMLSAPHWAIYVADGGGQDWVAFARQWSRHGI